MSIFKRNEFFYFLAISQKKLQLAIIYLFFRMETREVTCIAIVNSQGEILIQKRDEKSSKWGEEWSFFGGGIEQWETPEQALKREAKEELWLDIIDWSYTYIWTTYRFSGKVGKYYVRHMFFIPTQKAESEFTDQEWAWAKFVPLSELKNLTFVTPIETELELIKKHYEYAW